MANSPSHSGDSGGPTARHVDSTGEFEDLLASEDTVLVDFYADWCGPCRMMGSTVDELAVETEATVAKVNVEELPSVSAEYDVSGIPAFLVFEDGSQTDRLVGMQEKADLRAAVE